MPASARSPLRVVSFPATQLWDTTPQRDSRKFWYTGCFTGGARKAEVRRRKFGRVAERLMATDCKSVAPCELRRFESSPVHQIRF
jgi:hypothetical protein